MINREFTAVYKKHGKWFLAWVEEVPGVNTQGRTKKEARENLKEALEVILEESRKFSKRNLRGFDRESIKIAVPAL
jgi:predicted RNase H-like HicB family nuclease